MRLGRESDLEVGNRAYHIVTNLKAGDVPVIETLVLFQNKTVHSEETEIAILRQYLPQPLSQGEIVDIVRRIVDEVGATDVSQIGMVMREAMAQLKGQADGRLVNQIVRDILSH